MTWLAVASSRIRGLLSPRAWTPTSTSRWQRTWRCSRTSNIRRGMTPDAAARAARLTLGGITQLKEDYRERRGLPWLDSLWQDIRYASRTFVRNPGFTLMAILILTIGIGVNTTVFTLIKPSC